LQNAKNHFIEAKIYKNIRISDTTSNSVSAAISLFKEKNMDGHGVLYPRCLKILVDTSSVSRAGLKGRAARGNFHCRAPGPMTHFNTSYFVKVTFSLIRNVFACFFR